VIKKIFVLLLIISLMGCDQINKKFNNQQTTVVVNNYSLEESYSIIYDDSDTMRERYYYAIRNTNDYKIVTKELEQQSLSYFSNNTYYLKEGSVLSKEDIKELLSNDSMYSLQPQDSINGVTYTSMVSSIYEIDFLVEEENQQYTTKAMSIALLLEPKNEANETIEDQELYQYALSCSNYLILYIKEILELDIDVYVGFYRLANQKDDYSGHYIGGIFNGKGYRYQEQQVIFPSNTAKSIDEMTYNEFLIVKSFLKDFSIDSIGIIGYAYYKESSISTMNIQLLLNTKSYLEEQAIIQYTAELIDSQMSKGYNIQVFIYSEDNMVALVYRDSNGKIVTKFL